MLHVLYLVPGTWETIRQHDVNPHCWGTYTLFTSLSHVCNIGRGTPLSLGATVPVATATPNLQESLQF